MFPFNREEAAGCWGDFHKVTGVSRVPDQGYSLASLNCDLFVCYHPNFWFYQVLYSARSKVWTRQTIATPTEWHVWNWQACFHMPWWEVTPQVRALGKARENWQDRLGQSFLLEDSWGSQITGDEALICLSILVQWQRTEERTAHWSYWRS